MLTRLVITFGCFLILHQVLILLLHKFIEYRHELAHAKAALKQGHSEVFVVLKDARRKEDEYVEMNRGIKIYHVTFERFHNHCGFAKRIDAVTIYDQKKYGTEEIQITKAGPAESTRWNILISLAFTSVLLVLLYFFRPLFEDCFFSNILYFSTIALLSTIIICVQPWLFFPSQLTELEFNLDEKIDKQDKQMKISPISDGTKLRYPARFAEAISKRQEHIELFISFEEKLEWFKDLDTKQDTM